VPLVAWGLAAQDTTKAAAPPANVAQDTTKPGLPATPDTTPAVPLPASHTVTRGETLWSIAQMYFSDPLLWPEIFRLNTSAIEDPHWIYPGQVLTLGSTAQVAEAPMAPPPSPEAQEAPTLVPPSPVAQGAPTPAVAESVHAQPTGADTVAAAAPPVAPIDTTTRDTSQEVAVEPPPPPPPPVEEESYETIFDRPRTAALEVQSALRAYAEQPYRPVRRGEFYSAGFLTESEQLPWGDVVGSTQQSSIPRLTERSTAYQFEQIVIEPPHSASYHVNDSLLIARIARDEGPWGQVVVPTAVARVVEVAQHQLLAEIVTQFGPIHNGQHVLPLEPFKDPGDVTPTLVDQGLRGHVIAQRDEHVIATSMQILFIDRGSADGVVPGDVFEIYSGDPGTPSSQRRAVIEIVHTRDHSASGVITGVENPEILRGLSVRLIRKMPS